MRTAGVSVECGVGGSAAPPSLLPCPRSRRALCGHLWCVSRSPGVLPRAAGPGAARSCHTIAGPPAAAAAPRGAFYSPEPGLPCPAMGSGGRGTPGSRVAPPEPGRNGGPGLRGAGRERPEQPVITDKYRPGAGSQSLPWGHRLITARSRHPANPTAPPGLGKGARGPSCPHLGVGVDPRGPPCTPVALSGLAGLGFPPPEAPQSPRPLPGTANAACGGCRCHLLPPVTPPGEGHGGLQPPRSVPRDPKQLWDPRAEGSWPCPRAGTARAPRPVLQGPRQVPPGPGDPFGGGPGGAAGSPRRQRAGVTSAGRCDVTEPRRGRAAAKAGPE